MAKKKPPSSPKPPQRYGGVFDPPSLGADVSPIRVAGPGHLEFGEAGLTAVGFEPSGMGLRSIKFVLAVAAMAVALTWIRMTWFPQSSQLVLGVAAGLLGIGLYRVLMTGQGHHPDRPHSVTYPWASVRKISDDVRGRGLLVIRVDQADLRGTLHFKPDLSAESVRTAFRRRGVTVK